MMEKWRTDSWSGNWGLRLACISRKARVVSMAASNATRLASTASLNNSSLGGAASAAFFRGVGLASSDRALMLPRR
jgi:hypothetical protein